MVRFSLVTLFLLVLLAGLGCAALLYASQIVEQIAVTAAALVLILASLVALFGSGRRRALAGGFAFVGWVYLVLAFSSALGVQQKLLTRNVSGWLYGQLHEDATRMVPRTVNLAGPVVVGQQPMLVPPPALPASTLLNADGVTQPAWRTSTVAPQPVWQFATTRTVYQPVARVDRATFLAIGDALWALLLALLGAVAASVIYARGRRAPGVAAASNTEVDA